MSVLIKGFKMPKHCIDCVLEEDGYCFLINDEVEQHDKSDNCPLVDVPTPHGRLVDADGIVKYANCEITSAFAYPQGTRQDDEKRYRENWGFVRTVVIATPTVIEGEE